MTPQSFEAISAEELNDFVTMMVTFIGAPKYVKNPYLRATFTKLLCYLVPKHDDEMGRRHASERLASVFHTHPLAQRALAPSVMQVRAPSRTHTNTPTSLPTPLSSRCSPSSAFSSLLRLTVLRRRRVQRLAHGPLRQVHVP